MQITSMEKFHVQEASQKEEIEEAYEKNTGLVIIETFKDKNPVYVPGVLCTNHGHLHGELMHRGSS